MEDLLSTALDSGLGAVALIAFILLAVYQRKDHKSERKMWKDTSEKQFKSINELTKESIRANEKNTSALQSMREALERDRKDC